MSCMAPQGTVTLLRIRANTLARQGETGLLATGGRGAWA